MSQAKKGGLGRGLAALIPTGPETAPGGLGTIPTAPTTVPNGTAANGTAAPARPAPARPVPTGTAKKVLGATPNGLGTAAADVIIGVDPAEVPAVSPLPENVDRNADGDLRSEEHSLNSSHVKISYAVFCLKKKRKTHE